MKKSSIARYSNLIRFVKNWGSYFTRKFNKSYADLLFILRSGNVKLTTPAKSLYLVFKEIFVADVYDMRQLAQGLPEKPVVIDIGSNAGYFSLFLLSRKPAATIYGYDAVGANLQLVKKHLEMNPQFKSRLTAFHRAVTGTPQDFITIYTETDDGNSVTASVYNDFVNINVFSEQVPCISLREIFEQQHIRFADLIKIDCEGSEYPIIYETPEALWANVGKLAMEVHDIDNQTRNLAYLQQYLTGLGFSYHSFPLGNDCHMLFAEKKADAQHST